MSPLTYALLSDVIASLENAGGAPLGTAAYLQVQELVRQLPADTKPEDLKTLLAPLLCRSKEEQEQFYGIFEASWARVRETGELEAEAIEQVEAEIQVQKRTRRWRASFWYVLLLLSAIGGFILWRNSNPERIKPTRVFINAQVGTSGQYAVALRTPGELFRNECEHDSTASIRWDSIGHDFVSDQHPDVHYRNIHYTALKAGVDSFCVQLKPDVGSFRRRYTIVFNISDTIVAPPERKDTVPKAEETEIYQERPIPYPRDLSQLEPPRPTAFQQFLLDYEWPLKAAFILLSGLLLWWLARRIERNRRRLIAEHRPNVRPPYTWNISLGAEPDVTFGEDFYNLLLLLRRRESDERWQLDVPRTVRATVDKGGMPEFRYAQQTRPAEYLLLIDRQNGRDHQARLFDLLYRTFRSQEVLVERYWYDEGDPRRCFNETHPGGLSLRDLQYYHPQSRVLLLGNAYALLHPETGNLSKWALQTFSTWADRAVLSTQALGAFGRRERILQELFQVVPASFSGLRTVIDLFDADEGKTPDLDPRHYPDAAQQPVQLIDNDLIKTLQLVANTAQGIDAEKFITHPSSFIIWIAACAMYPELHWDLTLQLGHLLDGIGAPLPSEGVTSSHPLTKSGIPANGAGASTTHHASLLTHPSLQALCRLPWFTEGEMPLEVRKILLAWLEREHPETHYQLRKGLHELLAKNPPPSDSAAYDDYAMNLALNEWLYTQDRDRKKQLQREIAARLAAGQPADFMVLRMLEPGKSLTPEQFEVPADWKKHLREKGHAFLNPRRAWWWAVPVWVVLCGLGLWWSPNTIHCKGESVLYNDYEYCLDNTEKLAFFQEMLLQDMLSQNENEKADSIFNQLIRRGWQNRELSNLYKVLYIRDLSSNSTISPDSFSIINIASHGMISSDSLEHLDSNGNISFSWNGMRGKIIEQKPYLDSISFLQNATIAYFNKGVRIHLTLDSLERALPEGKGEAYYLVRSEACGYFNSAQEINALLPDTLQLWYVREASKCNLPAVRENTPNLSQTVGDIKIFGQVLNDATGYRLYYADLYETGNGIEAKGLGEASVHRGATFSLYVPANRKTPVEMVVKASGYEPLNVTVRPADFGKQLSLSLRPLKCYESYLLGGRSLMRTKDYREAIEKFNIAARCPDLPKGGNDLNNLIVEANRLAIAQEADSNANADDDGDGVINKDDQCPDRKGTLENKGCPPLANPGLISAIKDMLNVDTDGDGILNKDDRCPTEKGERANNGCPVVDKVLTDPSKIHSGPGAEYPIIRQLLLEPGEIVQVLETQGSWSRIGPGQWVATTYLADPSQPSTNPGPALNDVLAEIEKNMVSVAGGTFQMGCDDKRDGKCLDNERPVHSVRLDGFFMSKFEVTQAQWLAVMGNNPGILKNCNNCPIENVTWNDVQEFLKKLNVLTGKNYRLPTEAEWEYAARGGQSATSQLGLGISTEYAGSNKLDDVAWYSGNSGKRSHPVGSKNPNDLGLYDMSGNVAEWCSDGYGEYLMTQIAVSNPQGASKSNTRIFRGGSWLYGTQYCRLAYRSNGAPGIGNGSIGFRLALSP